MEIGAKGLHDLLMVSIWAKNCIDQGDEVGRWLQPAQEAAACPPTIRPGTPSPPAQPQIPRTATFPTPFVIAPPPYIFGSTNHITYRAFKRMIAYGAKSVLWS
jgi:hypothetical protein